MNIHVEEVKRRHAEQRGDQRAAAPSSSRALVEPWVQGTVDDQGDLLRLADLTGADIVVEVYGHEGVAGEMIRVVWASISTASRLDSRATPPFESEWVELSRPGQALNITIPHAEANKRAGRVRVTYKVYKTDGSEVTSPPHELDVEGKVGLEPFDVLEADDANQIPLDDVPADGASLSVPRQPSVPAGSVLTFFWEGVDTSGQPVRGYAVGYDNGNTPTIVKLPRGDLQRIAGKVAIHYTADTSVRAMRGFSRGIRPRAHLVSDTVQFDVIGSAAYPAPTVPETHGTVTLLPADAAQGATVAFGGLVASDQVTVSFGTHTTSPVAGAASMLVPISPAVVAAHLGQQIDVYYTVTRGGQASPSQKFIVTVGRFADGDTALPAPRIDVADSETYELNLGNFDGDPQAIVDPWPLMATGQTVWLQIEGTRADESAAKIILLAGEQVTGAMIGTGVQALIVRTLLESWKDDSELIVTCKVNFAGGVESGAVTFVQTSYRLLVGGASVVTGRLFEREDFEDPTTIVANGDTYRMRFFSVKPSGGRLQPSSSGSSVPYIDRRCAYLYEAGSGVTAHIVFDHPGTHVELGVKPYSPSVYTEVIAYDSAGEVIGRKTPTQPSWVTFDAIGERRVASLDIKSQSSNATYFDNLLVESGSPWDIISDSDPRHVEQFDDLPIGEYGNHYEFDRWHINIDGTSNRTETRTGRIAIEKAPSGMFDKVLAIHMTPYGRIHQLTPQFAVCPTVRTAFYMKSSTTTTHSVTVNLVYVNKDDKTLRTVSKTFSLGSQAYLVEFKAVTEVAKDGEYVSHLRIVHQSPTQLGTIYYDDIVFEN